jgi:hypothetical protein
MCLDQQLEGGFHSGPLGCNATPPNRLTNQAVINVNIGPHHALLLMCKHPTILCITQEEGETSG